MAQTTAIATRPAAPVQTSNVPALDFSQIAPDIMARAAAIATSVMAAGGSINPAQALAAAFHFADTGEVIGRHSYVGTTGNVAGRVLEGYRAVARELDMSKYQWRYRPLDPNEERMNNIQPGDRAMICEVDVLAARRQCIEMGIDYQPVIGCTVVRKGEALNVPKNRSSLWVLQKQARIDALRQIGENTSADEVLSEAGITDAPDGYLSPEQAEALVAERLAEALRAAQVRSDAELLQAVALSVAAMRGPATDDPLGIDEPPPHGRPAEPPTSDAEFAAIPNAGTERAAAAIRARMMSGIPADDAKAHPEILQKLQGGLHVAVPNAVERHALTAFLFGSDDPATWTQTRAMAVRSWLNIGKAGDGYAPSAKFVEDWKIIKAALPPPAEIIGK